MTHRDETIEDKPVGLKSKTLITIAIGMLTIEATILGVYYGMKDTIKDVNYANVMQDKRMDQIEKRQDQLEVRISKNEDKIEVLNNRSQNSKQ